LELDETFEYLGIEEGEGIDNRQMNDKLMKKYHHQFQQILMTELNSKNKITPTNTFAVPVLVYSFGIVNWFSK
jgi:hypothetical protein